MSFILTILLIATPFYIGFVGICFMFDVLYGLVSVVIPGLMYVVYLMMISYISPVISIYTVVILGIILLIVAYKE